MSTISTPINGSQPGQPGKKAYAPSIINRRPNRIPLRRHEDPHVLLSYGNPITTQKHPRSIRLYFQNVKGLSYTTTREDYQYVFQSLNDIQIDIVGLAETNSAWQHNFLRNELTVASKSIGAGIVTRTSFASPSKAIDNHWDISSRRIHNHNVRHVDNHRLWCRHTGPYWAWEVVRYALLRKT